MILHTDSHLDHGITPPVSDYLLEQFGGRSAFFIETVELPEWLGTVPCALVGPLMGDPPVLEAEEIVRGERSYPSRVLRVNPRNSRQVTVIAGPHDGDPCVLYTAFGGPLAPKEPGDPTLTDEERAKSVAFWSEHALAIGDGSNPDTIEAP